MQAVVTTEHHFVYKNDGNLYSVTGGGDYSFWKRYMQVFDGVVVAARVRQVGDLPQGSTLASGPGVEFLALPDYVGPEQYLGCLAAIKKRFSALNTDRMAIILRVPGTVAWLAWRTLCMHDHPYAVEVVGDPYDVFSPGAVRHVMRPIFRWWGYWQQRLQCAHACAVAYVTKESLQRRYPPGLKTFVTNWSDVELPPEALASGPRAFPTNSGRPIRLITVGSLAQMYKGVDVLIDAVAICVGRGLNLELVIVGDGRYRHELEMRTRLCGLGPRVRFMGQLPPGEPVRSELDRADLFVLPSRSEGLPRAMIEAMARALPCIGSSVGGIPELLPAEDLVPPGDPAVLACKICEVVTDPKRMAKMSAMNLAKAREYRADILQEQRNVFYQYVKHKTEEWMRCKL